MTTHKPRRETPVDHKYNIETRSTERKEANPEVTPRCSEMATREIVTETQLGQDTGKTAQFNSVPVSQTQIHQDRAKNSKGEKNGRAGVVHAVASAPPLAATVSGPTAKTSDVNVRKSDSSNRMASMGEVAGT